MTTTNTPADDVDIWGHTPALRAAQALAATAIATGGDATVDEAARALIVAAAAHAWPTATALVYTYEAVGTYSGFWALRRVEDADGQVLREWENEPFDMSDETEAELVALDLISNRPETQAFAATFGPIIGPVLVDYRTLML